MVQSRAQETWHAFHRFFRHRSDREVQLAALQSQGRHYVVVRVDGYRMKIDLRDQVLSRWLFLYGCWEPFESRLMRRLLRAGMTVLDVGAHAGYYSLLAGRAVGPSGRVLAFEPSPANFDLLQENIRLNHFGRIISAENAACASENGETTLYLCESNTGDHRIYATSPEDDAIFNGGRVRPSVRVRKMKLDGYLQSRGIRHVDAVKIDVQGAELEVLNGLRETLQASPQSILFVEFWPHGLISSGAEPQALLDLLTQDLGFKLFRILTKERQVVPIDPKSFALETAAIDPRIQVDLIAAQSSHPVLEASAPR